MPPTLEVTATSLVPSLDEATDAHEVEAEAGALLTVVQVIPELVDVYMPPPDTTAASFLPSVDEATEDQEAPAGALVKTLFQVIPESVDV